MVIVIMGVTGSGKSTIGQLLSQRLTIPFLDADQFHPPANIEKMKKGIPLNDQDRLPWLQSLARTLQQYSDGVILACSALKEGYRKVLQANLPHSIVWVHLEGRYELIHERLKNRSQHFMPSTLLQSQYDTLERPKEAITVSIEHSPEDIVAIILKKLKQWYLKN